MKEAFSLLVIASTIRSYSLPISDMARKSRLLIEGGFYHVMRRGNGGSDIFFSDEDRAEFERL